MFETINLFGLQIYTFWLTLAVCFFLFIWMLKKISWRFGINFSYFTNRALWLLISTFFFSRLFYLISNWVEISNGLSLKYFFFTRDYNFSLIWALFGFLLVVFITTRIHRIKSWKYLDAIILSFLFASVFWYIWAFLWWQIYWGVTNFWIEIAYNSSNIPYQKPIFPLAIVYSIVTFIMFSLLYIFAMMTRIRWIAWFIGLITFWSSVIALEFLSWKHDSIQQLTYNLVDGWINFNQISSIFLIFMWFYWILRIAFNWNKEKDLIF
jgi:hypothetical protein